MSYEACLNANEQCRFYDTELGCVSNEHHIYYPKKRYTTGIERQFRELPENRVQMCLDEHRELHATQRPPEKPSREIMLQAIAARAIGEVA